MPDWIIVVRPADIVFFALLALIIIVLGGAWTIDKISSWRDRRRRRRQ